MEKNEEKPAEKLSTVEKVFYLVLLIAALAVMLVGMYFIFNMIIDAVAAGLTDMSQQLQPYTDPRPNGY